MIILDFLIEHSNMTERFHQIINYLSKFSPITTEVCDSIGQLASVQAKWMWNANYQRGFYKAKSIIKEDT